MHAVQLLVDIHNNHLLQKLCECTALLHFLNYFESYWEQTFTIGLDDMPLVQHDHEVYSILP